MAQRKRVGIVGAGISGVCAVKICLEMGMDPVCLEQKHDMGGLWLVQEKIPPWITGDARAYKNLYQLATKTFYSFPDFPPKKEDPLYYNGERVVRYLKAYSAHFGCDPYIHYNRSVTDVFKAQDYKETGRWVLKHVDAPTKGGEKTEELDAVFFCSGYYRKAVYPPPFPGQEKFKGTISHSGSFWDDGPFVGKRVVIVGGSQSAANIATQLAMGRVNHVTIMSRDGFWLLPQCLPEGKTAEDLLFGTRIRTRPFPEMRDIFESACMNRFDHAGLGLAPKKPPIQVLIGEIGRMEEAAVVLKDGRTVAADAVILATGFKPSFPYLRHKEMFPESAPEMRSWLFFYPLEQEHPTLFLIGMFLLFSALPPLAELQTRAACMVLKGELKLPSRAELEANLEAAKKHCIAVFGRWPPLHTEGYSIALATAKFIGCAPEMKELEKVCPDIAAKLAKGSLLPPYFRLLGPNAKFAEARETILAMDSLRNGRTAIPAWTPPTDIPK